MRESNYEKELRIGLVLYGGVSLAIYIYGVVFEFLRLVREEGAYAKLTQKTRLKPVIDVISGSSAGGINGLFLAKALTTGASLTPLKEVWIQKGDLETLVNAATNNPLSLLDSDYYEQQLREALQQIKADTPEAKAKRSTSPLDLFITATNLDGVVTEYGKPFFRTPIQTKHYGTVLHFQARPGSYDLVDLLVERRATVPEAAAIHLDNMIGMLRAKRRAISDFSSEDTEISLTPGLDKNFYLARVAAATSAFPVAFRPVSFKKDDISTMKQLFSPKLFGSDALGLEVRQTKADRSEVYGDGGMVNNKPFSHTLRTIFHRHADGPVDRKLFFIEPDPEAFSQTSRLADQERVDGIHSLLSFFEATFYESISTDLSALVSQNQHIENVSQTLMDFVATLAEYLKRHHERKLADQSAYNPRQMYQEQPVYTTYQRMKLSDVRQELEKNILDKAVMEQLAGALAENPPQDFLEIKDPAEQEIYVQNHLKQVFDQVLQEEFHTLQLEEDIGAFLRRFDYPFRIRRLRYFINKLNMWLNEVDVLASLNPSSEDIPYLRQTLGKLKGMIYAFVEFYDHGVWLIWDDAPPIVRESEVKTTLEYVSGRYDTLMDSTYKNLAYEMIGEELAQAVTLIQQLRPVSPYPPQYTKLYELQRTTAYLENMLTDCVDSNFVECMERVFNTYEFLDMYLYPATVLANIGEADPIEVIRVSPKDAVRYRTTVEEKLAGEKLMHFSAFLKRSWRENDLLWGRLDAAEIIVRTLLPNKTDEPLVKEILDELCPAIIKEELVSIRERREVEISQTTFTDNQRVRLQDILHEYTTLKEAKDTEDYLQKYYTTGLEGFEAITQDYLLRTSAKSLRTISRLLDQRAALSRSNASTLSFDKPVQYLTSLLNLPYIFLVTLGGAEEGRRKKFFNFAFIVGTLLIVLHFIGGLVLQSWLLLGVLVFILFYLRPNRLIAIVITLLALLIALFTLGIIDLDICFQNPLSDLRTCLL